MPFAHPTQGSCRRLIGKYGETTGQSTCLQRFDLCRPALFAADPDLFEKVIEAYLVVWRRRGAAIGGIRERTSKRMARAMLRGVEVETAVSEFDAAVGLPRDIWIVRDHQNRVPRVMKLLENSQDDFFVRFIEVAGRLVGQNNFRLID